MQSASVSLRVVLEANQQAVKVPAANREIIFSSCSE
jgi:hypothetical protein